MKGTGIVRHIDLTGRVVVPIEFRRTHNVIDGITDMEITLEEEGLIKITEHVAGMGVIRRLDHLGRIVIPSEIRRTQGIVHNTEVEILVDEKAMYVRKTARSCRLCLEDIANRVTFPFKNHLICGSCMSGLVTGVYAE